MGAGLFLLRAITALTISYFGFNLQEVSLTTGASGLTFARLASILLPILGVLTLFGFATVITGSLSCVVLLVSFSWMHAGLNGLSLIASGLSLVLILVGPGAYSLDSHFFGWRRIEIRRRPRKPRP